MKLSRRIEEEILLLKIKHGDQAAFAVIYDRYVDALYRFVVFRVPSEETAQDIVSELFLKVWQHLTVNQKKVDNIRPFLYQVARNLIVDYYRTTQESLPLEEAVEVKDTKSLSLDRQISLVELEKALRMLKDELQEIIILAHIEGLKHTEIASIIGKSTSATRVMLYRAMQELKNILNKN